MNWLSSIFRRKTTPALWSGRVLDSRQFQAFLGSRDTGADTTYAEINSSALPEFYNWFRNKLFDIGLTRWDRRQDCDDFSNLYADFLQLRFYLAQWERNPLPSAEALAVARVWYLFPSGEVHALNAVATDRGLLYIEPQTGEPVKIPSQATLIRCIF